MYKNSIADIIFIVCVFCNATYEKVVRDAYFAKEIEKRIGVQTNTSTVDKELAIMKTS